MAPETRLQMRLKSHEASLTCLQMLFSYWPSSSVDICSSVPGGETCHVPDWAGHLPITQGHRGDHGHIAPVPQLSGQFLTLAPTEMANTGRGPSLCQICQIRCGVPVGQRVWATFPVALNAFLGNPLAYVRLCRLVDRRN